MEASHWLNTHPATPKAETKRRTQSEQIDQTENHLGHIKYGLEPKETIEPTNERLLRCRPKAIDYLYGRVSRKARVYVMCRDQVRM